MPINRGSSDTLRFKRSGELTDAYGSPSNLLPLKIQYFSCRVDNISEIPLCILDLCKSTKGCRAGNSMGYLASSETLAFQIHTYT